MSGYADTSFLISLYTQDANSGRASRLLQETLFPLLITPFGRAEFVNTIELRIFRKEIAEADAQISYDTFDQDLNSGLFLFDRPVPAQAYEKAASLSRNHTRQIGTRAMDVLHVAIALELPVLVFFTFDKDQAKLARRAGLTVRPAR